MTVCETCGNEINVSQNKCPLCGTDLKTNQGKKLRFGIINLEKGLPTIEEAEKRLNNSLSQLFKRGANVIKIIHGYGSSGIGGKIKVEIRKSLMNNKNKGLIKFVIYGENFTDRDHETKNFIQKYPGIADDSDFKRGNKGITIIAK